MSMHVRHLSPVGGPVWTRTFRIMAGIAAVAMAIVALRFVVGIGPTTALNDGYPWGVWKVFNVVVLTALGSGGYAIALLVYVLNKGHYHPLVRSAILTSALGYTTGVIALAVDIGRPWNMWRLAIIPGWNLHSVLLEVAVCISFYLVFLWIEASPPFLEAWAKKETGRLRHFALWFTPRLEKAYPWIVATALLLPTMHQSSLGSLFILAGPRLHALWQTPMLPLLFLLSCYALGYAAVVLVAMISALRWGRPYDRAMIARLSGTTGWVLVAFLVIRWADVTVRGELAAVGALDRFSLLFLAETAAIMTAALGLLSAELRARPQSVFRMAMLVVGGGALYRLNASLVGFLPGNGWSYFPSVPEMTVSLGFVAMGVMGYLYVVKRFPILVEHVPVPVPVEEE